LCQRAIWLDKGRLMVDGPAPEVLDKYPAFENEKHDGRLLREIEQSLTDGRLTEGSGARDAADNAADVTSAAPIEGPTLPTYAPIAITGVRFLNGQGIDASAFRTGEPMVIRIDYNASRKVEDPTFGLALYSENGTQLNGPNTRFAGLIIPSVEGTGFVDYRVEALPLLAGRYDVTVAVTGPDMTEVYDHKHRKFGFSVQPTPGLPERWGMVLIAATWHLGGAVAEPPASPIEQTQTPPGE